MVLMNPSSDEQSTVDVANFQQDLFHQEKCSTGILYVKNTNIEGKAFVASTDSTTEREEDCDIFVEDLNTHDQSFELDAIDRQLMDLNLSSGTVNSSITQRKHEENDNTDSSLEEFIGFDSSDIASTSDTEVTDSSIIISDGFDSSDIDSTSDTEVTDSLIIISDDDDSTSNTTTRGGNTVLNSIVDTDENVSHFSSAIPPSVVESDDESDKTVPFSDGDAMSHKISVKMTNNVVPPSQDKSNNDTRHALSDEISVEITSNAVPPSQDDFTNDFSEDEIAKKLMLIRQFPNEIKKNQGSYYGGKRVGSYPTCVKKKIHSVNNVNKIYQKPVETNDSEEVNKTDGIKLE